MATTPQVPHPLPPVVVDIVANRFRALGEPMRIRILDLLRDGELADRGSTPVERADALGTTQQNVSKHVGVLQRAGIVGRRRDGVRTPYAITDETVLDLCGIVCGGIRRETQGLADALGG
ncbi:MAG: ArsR/SmtB family transcription factor [Gaiellales bacterium]